MTVLDLEEKPGKWFDMEGGGRVQLRTITAEDLKAIRKKTVKKDVVFRKVEGTPARFETETTDEDLQNELFWDHVIVAWENLLDGKKKPIPCTKEMKAALMSKSAKFARFIGESLKVLAEDETEQAELFEKN